MDKKIKIKEFGQQKEAKDANAQQEISDLEAESRSKDAELARLKNLLKERKDLLERTRALATASPPKVVRVVKMEAPAADAYNREAERRYEQLSNEIQSIKVQLATMNDVKSKEMLFEKVTAKKTLIE